MSLSPSFFCLPPSPYCMQIKVQTKSEDVSREIQKLHKKLVSDTVSLCMRIPTCVCLGSNDSAWAVAKCLSPRGCSSAFGLGRVGASLVIISPVNYSTIAWSLHNQKWPSLYIDTLISSDFSNVLNCGHHLLVLVNLSKSKSHAFDCCATTEQRKNLVIW